MAVLQKIRVKFGLAISIIIALALLSFIIDPSTLESALSSMSSKYDVGVINGKSVSYTDFQAEVDNFATISEMMTGKSAHSEQEQAQIRNAAWQSLIDKYLFVKNAKAAGINVGEAEMVSLTNGEMVSPVLANNYAFADENGEFNPAALVEFVQSVESDETGRLKAYWNYLQSTIYTQQFYAKYGSIFSSSDIQNPLMLQKTIEGNNNTANVEFVMVPFSFAADSTIVVSPAEIKKYYKDHKELYKQIANRDMEYVVYEVVPSEDDIVAVSESMSEIYEDFANASNMKTFLLKNSDRPLSDYWYREGELATVSADVDAFVAAAKTGDVSPVIRDGNTFYGVKVMAKEMIPDSAYVRHILIQGENAASLADSLLNVVRKSPATFSDVAALYSADKGSAADGKIGNIGWMTQTYMIPGFESVITAKVGDPFILNTQYGTHVVLVSEKSKPVAKKQVAIFEKTALASKETFNSFYAKANKFATIANGTYEGYKAALDSLGIYSHVLNVNEGTSAYGAVENAKEVTRWVFDSKPGKASNIITVNNKFFFVATVKTAHEEGYATIEEVASRISPILYNEKAAAKKTAEVADKIAGKTSLQEIAETFNTSVNSQNDVAFASMMAQSLDPALVGAVSVAPENKICGPVKGNFAVYVFQVTGRETGSFYTEEDARNMESQKAQYSSQMIIPTMMKDADVKDNRARFY